MYVYNLRRGAMVKAKTFFIYNVNLEVPCKQLTFNSNLVRTQHLIYLLLVTHESSTMPLYNYYTEL